VRDLTSNDLRNAILALAAADISVTNDSGLMHVSAAIGTPTVAIFGPTSPWHWKPLNPIAAILEPPGDEPARQRARLNGNDAVATAAPLMSRCKQCWQRCAMCLIRHTNGRARPLPQLPDTSLTRPPLHAIKSANGKSDKRMPKPQPADMRRERAQAAIESALRTLEAEGGGIDALTAALRDGLGGSFGAAIELIRAGTGRVIVTGMGKSGHVGTKIASTFASTGTPALFVHPAEASHGDLGMIAKGDIILALSWSGETAELKNLTDYFPPPSHRPDRDDGQCRLHAGQDRRRGAGIAAGTRSLPA